MNLKIGIVGLPNVGKSTLFNAITSSKNATAENFPFCTIEPNVGIVEVPDSRLAQLAEIVEPQKIIHSTVEFVDIAGLVAGASKGEGLGNKFLSHIRECQVICHVLRDFADPNVHHVAGKSDARADFDTILTELVLADLESVERQIERTTKKARSGDKNAKKSLEILEFVRKILARGDRAGVFLESADEESGKIFKTFNLLTSKKFLVVANTDESDFVNFDADKFRKKANLSPKIPVIPVCAKIEAELAELDDEEATEFLRELGADRSGLENLVRESFRILNLENYFTAGKKEVRSWTIPSGSTAPQAAGAIHTDFERGFISAEVVAFRDFVENRGEIGAREAGKWRQEGKNYIVQDGDVIHFRFNV